MKTSIFLGLCFLLLGAWARFSNSTLGYDFQGLDVEGTSANHIRNVSGLLIEERSWFLKSCLPLPQAWEFLPILLLLALCLTKGLKRLRLSILLVVLAAPYLSPTKAITYFDKTLYTVMYSEYHTSITSSNDGGYFIVSASTACGSLCVLLVKIDSDGVKLWETTQNPCSYHHPSAIDTTTDGGCVVTGWCSCSTDVAFVMRFYPDGAHRWFSEITTDANAKYIQVDNNDYYIIVGYLSSRLYMARVDSNGGLDWQSTQSLSASAVLSSTVQLSDGRIAGVGYWQSTDLQCLTFIMDLGGTQYTWFKYGGSGYEYCYGITQVSDGKLVIAGTSNSGTTLGGYDALLAKVSTGGTPIWNKLYGGSSDDNFLRVKKFADGTLAVAGEKGGVSDFWLLNIDPTDGSILREFFVGPSGSKTLYDMKVHPTERVAFLVGVTYGETCVSVKSLDCMAGTYLDTSANTCKKCLPGTYQDLADQSYCKQCSLGTYQNLYGQTGCINCPIGRYQDAQGQPTCKLCEAGYFQTAEGQDSCQKCPVGKFQSQTGQSACMECLAGQYQDAQGQATCKDCSAGQFQSAQGQTSCQDCPVGTYQDSTGAVDCKSCSTGHYQDSTGQTMCHPCELGYFQGEEGQVDCQPCAVGTHASAKGSAACASCSIGRYQDLTGQSECKACEIGYFQGEEGKTSCQACPLGTYAGTTGSSKCTLCSVGEYQNVMGQGSCIPCTAGYVQPETGKSDCTACAVGTHQPNEGQTHCLQCDPGTFQNETAQTFCYDCQPGYYQDLVNQTSCNICPAGSFQNETAKTSCFQCEIGEYQDTAGKTSCILCPVGTFQSKTSQASCNDCPPGSYQDLEGQSKCILCEVGTVQPNVKQTSCNICPIGYYQAETGKAECNICSVGTVQPETGKTSCNDCPIGYYQDEEGKDTCKACPAGSFQNITKQPYCYKCLPGYYQPNAAQTGCLLCSEDTYTSTQGATECLTCDPDWYPSVYRDVCLFKGIFPTEAAYLADSFYSDCFNATGLIKPYTMDCRESYHSLCCSGSTLLSTMSCNFGLEAFNTSMENNYCSACTFTNRSACPPNGLCWDDTTWLSNDIKPYPANYTLECLENISSYCAPRFFINSTDQECGPFIGHCFATVKSSAYGTTWDKFTITFTNKIASVLPHCNSLLNVTLTPALETGNITCTRASDISIEVNVSALEQPILNYSLSNNLTKDACGLYLPPDSLQSVAVPDPIPEVVEIEWHSDDKCMGLSVNSSITKPYPWPIEEQYWEVKYSSLSGIPAETTNRLNLIGNFNKTNISIADYDLFPDKILKIQSKIRTPYKSYVFSEMLNVTVPKIASGKEYCGPCQLDDRSKCKQFNGVCWKDYFNYTVTEPFNTTDCLKAMAPMCYSIWNSSSLNNLQCLDFKDAFDFAEMKIKPNATSAVYSYTGRSIFLIFDYPIYREGFVDCGGVFDQATLNWLPPSRACSWKTPTSLEIAYDPQVGILKEIGIKENAFFYDYEYSQESAIPAKIPIKMPPLEATIIIKGITTVSECDTVELFGVLDTPTLYQLEFKWELSYTPPLPDSIKDEADKYFAQFKEYSQNNALLIPSEFLVRNSRIAVTLFTKAAGIDSNIISNSLVINVIDSVAKIKFTSKSRFVLEIDGSQSNSIPLQIYNTKCSKGSNDIESEFIPVDVTFSVLSGSAPSGVIISGPEEATIEKNITDGYAKYKALFIGTKQGFKYLRYYNITAIVKSRYTGKINSDSLMVYFTKPPIKSVIDSPGSLVSIAHDIKLSGQNSILPAVEGDAVKYMWKCLSSLAMDIGGKCDCPVLPNSELRTVRLTLPKEKMTNKCKYKFSLIVSATFGNYIRSAYNETEFVTFTGSVLPLKGKVIKGVQNENVKDIYFTFGIDDNDPDDKVNYKWTLTEVISEDPKVNTKYTEKNTFVYNFFKNELKTEIEPKLKDEDTPIPTEGQTEKLQPEYLTPVTNRVLGINKTAMLPMHKYTFGVTVYHSTAPSFLFISFTTPPTPRPRKFLITPTTGVGFQTSFNFIFTLPPDTDIDEAKYQIYRRNCPSTESEPTPLTQPFSWSNSYTTTLAPGKKSCDYQVEIILKVFEYDNSVETKKILIVKEPELPIEEVLKSQVDKLKINTGLTMDQKLTILAEVSSTEIVEASDTAKETAKIVFDEIDSIDKSGGILEEMEDKDKPALLNAATVTMANLVIKQQPIIDIPLASSITKKVDKHLTEVKTKEGGSYIIPTCLGTLSGIADIGIKEQEETKFFSSMQTAMDTMADMKLNEMQPGGSPYTLTSPAIEMTIIKSYAEDYNKSKSIITNKGTNITLPDGIADQMLKNVKNTTGGTITFGVSLYSTSFNPFETIKNSTNITVESLTNGSTQGFKPETVQKIYADLAKGMHKDLVNKREINTDIVQLTFKPFELQKNASERSLNSIINIGPLPAGKEAVISLPAPINFPDYIKKSVMVPVYRVPDQQIWSNENCSLDTPNASNAFMTLRCTHVGPPRITNIKEGFTVTVDIVKDVVTVIRAGNYEQLTDFDALTGVNSRTIAAYLSAISILLFSVLIEFLLIKMDRHALYTIRLKCLFDRFTHREKAVYIDNLHNIFEFFSQMRRKGLISISNKSQQTTVPIRTTTEAGENLRHTKVIPKKKKKANGFNILSVDEKQGLRDLFDSYQQCSRVYNEAELEEVSAKELEKSEVLNRITQAYIDDRLVSDMITFWVLMQSEHPVLNALTKAEITNPRFVKFLNFICVLVGQLFVTGYFYDSESNASISESSAQFLSTAIIYTIAATLLMVPLKVLISVFLTRSSLSDDMKKEEIKKMERSNILFRRIGIVLAHSWILFCLYGIMMYIITFNSFGLNNWMFTFGASVFMETIIVSQLKVILKVLIGFFLMRLVKTRLMLTTAGAIAAYIVNLLAKIC